MSVKFDLILPYLICEQSHFYSFKTACGGKLSVGWA